MEASRVLRQARRQAGLTQRGLADRARVSQPLIARIERGDVSPRVETLDRLLCACGFDLELRPRLGLGLDRTVIDRLLDLTPGERARLAADEAVNLERVIPSRE